MAERGARTFAKWLGAGTSKAEAAQPSANGRTAPPTTNGSTAEPTTSGQAAEPGAVEQRARERARGQSAPDLTVDANDVTVQLAGRPIDLRDTGPRTLVGSPVAPERNVARWIIGALVVLVPAVVLRVVALDALGFNSDEAVYAGQAASIAGQTRYLPYFPVFRAHPLLFHTLLSIPYQFGVSPLVGRLLSAALGVATVGVAYAAGARVYSRRIGFVTALLLAVMPYHVVVTRQVLLDGPTTFFATVSLYLLIRYATSDPAAHLERGAWLAGAAAAMGLTFLTKETSILLMGGVYAFFALSPELKARARHLIASLAVYGAFVVVYPVSLALSGRQSTGNSFLVWQLFRRANHTWTFYFEVVPPAMGWLVVAAAIGGLYVLRRRTTWRETLLLCWILVPFGFLQLWPVKGFQYLLPIAPAVALLAARGLTTGADVLSLRYQRGNARVITAVAVTVTVAWLAVSSWSQVQPHTAGTEFLAGSGGVPGGREAGRWVRDNVPEGGQLLALGPSMANIIQFYGDRKAYGLSVSPNPLHRNPVYEPVHNPDYKLRNNDIQYLVWDSYSAARSSFFSSKLQQYAERYHGRVVHTESVAVRTPAGAVVEKPAIVIYEVRP